MENVFEDEEYLIEQFILDDKSEKEVLEVLRRSFINVYSDEGGTTEFTDTMFNILFKSPYIPRDHFVRTIHKPTGKVVGFVGAIPRTLYYNGKTYRTAFPSFIAVDPEHRRKRLAFRMAVKLVEMGKKLGYDGGIAFFEPEEHGISTGHAISREVGIPFVTISEIHKFLIRVFDVDEIARVTRLKWYEKIGLKLFQPLKRVKSDKVRLFKPEDGERIYSLLDDFKERTDMTFIRDREDFIWYLNQPGVKCVVHENEEGEIDGFITAFEFLLSGFGHSIKFGWIDVVHLYRLDRKEATELVKYFAQVAKDEGWVGLQTPFIPYFDPAPFKKANFVFFPKNLVVAMFPLSDVKIDTPVNSFYFDWR